MGLKSLVLFNRNYNTIFHNNSFLSEFIYNRVIFFFFFITKLLSDYFNSFFFFTILLNIKKTLIKNNFNNISIKIFFFGKINIFLFQKWFIIRVNSFNLKKKNYKSKALKFIKQLNSLKKKKIEL